MFICGQAKHGFAAVCWQEALLGPQRCREIHRKLVHLSPHTEQLSTVYGGALGTCPYMSRSSLGFTAGDWHGVAPPSSSTLLLPQAGWVPHTDCTSFFILQNDVTGPIIRAGVKRVSSEVRLSGFNYFKITFQVLGSFFWKTRLMALSLRWPT